LHERKCCFDVWPYIQQIWIRNEGHFAQGKKGIIILRNLQMHEAENLFCKRHGEGTLGMIIKIENSWIFKVIAKLGLIWRIWWLWQYLFWVALLLGSKVSFASLRRKHWNGALRGVIGPK
jgi:hypothetical protein